MNQEHDDIHCRVHVGCPFQTCEGISTSIFDIPGALEWHHHGCVDTATARAVAEILLIHAEAAQANLPTRVITLWTSNRYRVQRIETKQAKRINT